MRVILVVHVADVETSKEQNWKFIYSCDECGLVIDRDATGSRNIFIKNTRLRCP